MLQAISEILFSDSRSAGVFIVLSWVMSLVLMLKHRRVSAVYQFPYWVFLVINSICWSVACWRGVPTSFFYQEAGTSLAFGAAGAMAVYLGWKTWGWFDLRLLQCTLILFVGWAYYGRFFAFAADQNIFQTHVLRANYLLAISGFVAIKWISQDRHSIFGHLILLAAFVNQLLSLSKWGMALLILYPAAYISCISKRPNYISIAFKTSAAIAVLLLCSFMLRNVTSQRLGYSGWEEFYDKRISRENYAMDDKKFLGKISDGGRVAIWREMLSFAVAEPLLGTGFGVRSSAGIPDHNVIVFYLSRYGFLGAGLMFGSLTFYLWAFGREAIKRNPGPERVVLIAFAIFIAQIFSVGESYADPLLVFFIWSGLGIIASARFSLLPLLNSQRAQSARVRKSNVAGGRVTTPFQVRSK